MAPYELPQNILELIVALHRSGISYTKIIENLSLNYGLNVARSTIARTLNRYRETGTNRNKQGRGRTKKVGQRAERVIHRLALKDRWASIPLLASRASESLGVPLSMSTVRRVLQKFGLRRRIARRKPLLTKVQRRKRLQWAKVHKNWPIPQWHRVVYSDEKIFKISSNRKGVFVTRAVGEENRSDCTIGTIKHGTQVHVWGSIGIRGVGPLKRIQGTLNAQAYQDQILGDLEQTGPPIAGGNGHWVFMQDGAPPHTANTTRNYLAQKNIEVLDWPSNSPDLNPIENVWAYVQNSLTSALPRSANELWESVRNAWAAVPVELLQNLYNSIPTRLDKIIECSGGQSPY